jgi:uncharacterized Zn finger protein
VSPAGGRWPAGGRGPAGGRWPPGGWPEPSRPRPVTGGIQARSKRGSIGEAWWSRRFIELLESFGMTGRLSRGRNYARRGQVLWLTVRSGYVDASVQGSRENPYHVRIQVLPLTTAQWQRVIGALGEQAVFRARLLAGEMPAEIEEVFAGCGTPLFPRGWRDLEMSCSCPDWEVPCKHLAAVLYVLAERFDDDPFAMLALRGRDRETLLADLRERRAEAGPAPAHGTPLAEVLSEFYAGGPLPTPAAGPDTPSDALLDQVPPFPVEIRGITVSELLRPAYRALGGA